MVILVFILFKAPIHRTTKQNHFFINQIHATAQHHAFQTSKPLDTDPNCILTHDYPLSTGVIRIRRLCKRIINTILFIIPFYPPDLFNTTTHR